MLTIYGGDGVCTFFLAGGGGCCFVITDWKENNSFLHIQVFFPENRREDDMAEQYEGNEAILMASLLVLGSTVMLQI